MVACMEYAGWHVTPGLEDGVETLETRGGVPNGQVASYDRAQDTCTEETGWGGDPPALTEQQAAAEYDALVDAARCLAADGYSVEDPPSRQAYVAAAVAGRIAWWPYDAVLSRGRHYAQYTKEVARCSSTGSVP
jgi:hypothetical protein